MPCLPFKDKYYALTDYMSHPQDMCNVESSKPDLAPVGVRFKVKELEIDVDELESELAVKSTEMEKLKNENKTLRDKYIQLKGKCKDDPAMASQATVLDSLEQDPEV